MNLVTIIIPYYQKIKYIEETINSVLNQTFKDFEVLVIYDDENKSDINFIEKFCKKDNRVKLIINEKNLGAGECRNIGIGKSSSEFVAFLDADDVWQKEKLSKQINFMISHSHLASHTSYNIIDENGEKQSSRIAKKLNYKKILSSCDIGLSTVILRKEILDKDTRFPKLKTKEDYVMWLELTKRGVIFEALDENLACWRKTKNSLSSSTIRKLLDGYSVYRKYLGLGKIESLFRLFNLSINFLKKNV